jgi:hypothetical protein
MANTIDSDLYGVNIAAGAIRVMQSDVKPIAVFSTDFSPAPASKYGTVIVPLTTAGSTSVDFVAANGYVKGDTTVSERTVALSGHKYQNWHITDIEAVKSPFLGTNGVQQIGVEKTQKLLIDVFSNILSVVTLANYGNAATDKLTVAAAAFDRDDLVDLAGLCDNANWPEVSRNVLLKPDHWRAVTKDQATAADAYGAASIRQQANNGFPMDGFDGVWRCNSIPANNESLVGFACMPSAIAIANRYLPPVNGGAAGSVYQPITEPTTGLTLGYREYYDDQAGCIVAVLECLYGFQIGNATAIKRIVTA